MNTESASAFSDCKQVFSASVVTEPEAKTEEGSEMSESVEVKAEVETPEVELEQSEAVETVEAEGAEVEMAAEEKEEAAEETVEAELAAEVEVAEEVVEEKPAEFSAVEFSKIVDEFGADPWGHSWILQAADSQTLEKLLGQTGRKLAFPGELRAIRIAHLPYLLLEAHPPQQISDSCLYGLSRIKI